MSVMNVDADPGVDPKLENQAGSIDPNSQDSSSPSERDSQARTGNAQAGTAVSTATPRRRNSLLDKYTDQSSHGDQCDSHAEQNIEEPLVEEPKPPSVWAGADGIAVMAFGILFPAVVLAATSATNLSGMFGFLLRNPIESSTQLALAWSAPVFNLLAWTAIRTKDLRGARRQAIFLGTSTASVLCLAFLTSLMVGLSYPARDFHGIDHSFGLSLMSMTFWLAFTVSVYLVSRFRELFPTRSAKFSTLVHVGLGAVLALTALFLSEAKNLCMRFAENLAVSSNASQKSTGLNFLRASNSERMLRMDCSAPWTMDLSGLFFKFDGDTNRKLYFQVTGEPFRFDAKQSTLSAMPDTLLGQQVVGEKLANLSMVRSLVSGLVHPETRSATVDWTFVFKNDGFTPLEARAELGIPKDAVISDMVLWMNGTPKRATITTSESAKAAYQWVVQGRRDPALVTDLGRGRVLVQCYPVPANSEMKVKVSMTTPVTADGAHGVLTLPRIIKSNFEVVGHHSLRLRSNKALKLNLEGTRSNLTKTGLHLVSGEIENLANTNESVVVYTGLANLPTQSYPLLVRDPYKHGSVIVQQLEPVPVQKPEHLVVVVDGSQTMEKHKKEIADIIAKVPSTVPTSLIVASTDAPADIEHKPLKQALESMKNMKFEGGQENLESVARAAELAGESEGGAVLWIHGPQPSLDKELYIVAPYIAKPSFYDFSIDDSVTDLTEFVKNVQEIGPFVPVARNGKLADDLARFVNRWQADGKDLRTTYRRIDDFNGFNANAINCSSSPMGSQEVAQLYAAQEVRQLIQAGRRGNALDIATRYGVVTPLTSAVVLENAWDYDRNGITQNERAGDGFTTIAQDPTGDRFNSEGIEGSVGVLSDAASGGVPNMQGATNGSIGPQGVDATSVMGINTAGTVRVNNLAVLESWLNLITFASEAVSLACGGFIAVLALMKTNVLLPFITTNMGRDRRVILGMCLITIGFALPGFVNGLLSSARDCNLFN